MTTPLRSITVVETIVGREGWAKLARMMAEIDEDLLEAFRVSIKPRREVYK